MSKLVVLLIILTISCSPKNNNKEEGKIITDYFGRTIELDNTISRIIVLYYVQAELICAIGGKDKLVGIGKINDKSSLFLSTYFPDILKLPQVGHSSPNYEYLISLQPDLIFTGTERKTVERLEELGLCTIATYPKSLNDIMEEVVLYGEILNKNQEAKLIFNYIQNLYIKLQNVSAKIPISDRPKVYYIRTDALTSMGGNVLSEVINLAGGTLVTKDLGDNNNSLQMSFENIYKYNPDVIIIRDRSSIRPIDIYNDSRWSGVSAVKNKKVFQESSGWTEFRLETIFGIIEKGMWLHPELFKDFDPRIEYLKFIDIVNSNQ